jgi:hypothetical protein
MGKRMSAVKRSSRCRYLAECRIGIPNRVVTRSTSVLKNKVFKRLEIVGVLKTPGRDSQPAVSAILKLSPREWTEGKPQEGNDHP